MNTPLDTRLASAARHSGTVRWSVEQIEALLGLPLPELLFQAQTVHRELDLLRRSPAHHRQSGSRPRRALLDRLGRRPL